MCLAFLHECWGLNAGSCACLELTELPSQLMGISLLKSRATIRAGVVHSIGLSESVMTSIHYGRVIEDFTRAKHP